MNTTPDEKVEEIIRGLWTRLFRPTSELMVDKERLRTAFLTYRTEIRKEIAGEVLRMKQKPTKHEGCTLDDNFCYDHQEMMEDKSRPNGATAYNSAIDDIIASITK